jgi:hypothetical protein
MKRLLFQPFEAYRWFTFGFCAWLATLTDGGCNFNLPGGGRGGRGGRAGAAAEPFQRFGHWCGEHLALVLLLALLAVGVGVGLWLLLLWLSSRGKFMFLDNVVTGEPRIGIPWREYRAEARSLMLWRIGFTVVALFLVLAAIGIGILPLLPLIRGGGKPEPLALVMSLLPLLLLVVTAAFALGVVASLLEAFVIPRMFALRQGCLEAWRGTLAMLRGRWSAVVAFLLAHFLLGLLAGVAILAAVLVTCCIAGCLLALPYLGAVLLLPVTVFFRLFSLEFLKALEPELRPALEPAAAAVPPPEMPAPVLPAEG